MAAPSLTTRLSSGQLLALADDAFVVLNWAKRNGMNRQQQLAEVVKTFEVRLGYRKPKTGEVRS